jgi:hypothetical protein
MTKALASCLILALGATFAWAQLPAGGEFRVNSYTTGNQSRSRVSVDGAGNFVVVWQTDQNDVGDIYARRYDATGSAIGGEFRVNGNLGSYETRPDVAMTGSGFMVVWTGSGYSVSAIKARRFDASGAPLASEFNVNSYITSSQYWPSIAADRAGNFVVVWSSFGQDGSDGGIFGQRLSASGAPIGGEFAVNTYTTGGQYGARVAVDADGDFVVAWTGDGQDGSSLGVVGRRFSAAGVPRGGEFQVNTSTIGVQRFPAVASDGAGNFVIAWDGGVAYYGVVHARRYDASGAPLTGELVVNQYTTLTQGSASVDRDLAGNFVVTWTSYSLGAEARDIRGRVFDPEGVPLGAEFRVNTYTTDDQAFSSVALGNHGDVVVVWDSYGQDAPASGAVYAQRYSDLIFADGFEPSGP